MEQQHVRQYLEGEGGPPLMTGDGSQARFVRETQQWINSEDQVSPTHPSASSAQVTFVTSSLTTLLFSWTQRLWAMSKLKPKHTALVENSKAVATSRLGVDRLDDSSIHLFDACLSSEGQNLRPA